MASVHLLGLAGSIRKASYTKALLENLALDMPEQVRLHIHPLNDLPLYNEDNDGDHPPEAAIALRAAIAAADGLVIATPEYNYGISGVLKNALDWASRPYGKAVLTGKPVVTMSASLAFTGGVRAQAQLHETLLATQSRLVVRYQTVIGEVHKKIVDGKLIDSTTQGFARAAIEDLIKMIATSHTT